MASEYVSIAEIAKMLGVSRDTIRQWRHRNADFPERDHGTAQFPQYDRSEVVAWYLKRWPERSSTWDVTLHRFHVNSTEATSIQTKTLPFGPVSEARGYLRAVRDLQYRDWRTWQTSEGIVAEKANDIHIWYLDPSNGEPEDWYTYQARIKAGSQKK